MARRYAGILPDLSLPVFCPPTVTVPRVGTLQQRDELEHAALARAGTPGEKHELTRLNGERHAGQRFAAIRVTLRDVVENDHGGDSRVSSPCFRASAP